MPKKPKKPSSRIPTVVDDIYGKLGELLSPTEFRNSAQIIGSFEKTFPDDWKLLVTRFGHRDETPGKKGRRHYYAASTYVADRLASMKRMGLVELKHITDGYDQTVWKHNRRMGSWRLIGEPEPTAGEWKFLTVRMAGEHYDRLAAEAAERKMSVSALAAAKGRIVCTRHFAKFIRELECLLVALTESKRLGGGFSDVVIGTQNAVEDAREEMMKCRDCRIRYEEMNALGEAKPE